MMTHDDLRAMLAECEELIANDRQELAKIQAKERRDIADCVATKTSMPNNHWVGRVKLENKITALLKLRETLTDVLGIQYGP